MRKLLWFIVCLMTMVVCFTSCSASYSATATYDVCYPDGTQRYTKSVVVKNACDNSLFVKSFSFGGTNYISVFKTDNPMTKEKSGLNIESTTAPIRLIDYSIEPLNKKKGAKGGDGVYIY